MLKDISVRIEAKGKTGIIGRIRAGKSSIANAIFRVVEPTSGKIMIDGVDILTVDARALHRAVAFVRRFRHYSTGDLRSNLDPFGEHDDDTMMAILKCVGLAEVFRDLSHRVGESDKMSFGQRQLICFGRTLLRQPSIVLMDEATASVPGECDNTQVQQMVEKLDATVLTIAHRLQTIRNYDHVLVLDGGRVTASGRPEEVLMTRLVIN